VIPRRCSVITKKRSYTEEFKLDAVKLVIEQGYSVREAASNLGITDKILSRWKREYLDRQDPAFQKQEDQESEVKRLRKENARLKMEREILKKAAAFFANESK